jgi:hypothetical protein
VTNGGGGAAGLGGMKRGTELTGGACMSARGEGEGAEGGRRKPKRKTYYLEDAKGAWACRAGWVREWPAEGRVGWHDRRVGWAGLQGMIQIGN